MAEPADEREACNAAARPAPRPFRIFLSSPGDVGEERKAARRLIKERLPVDPFLRNRASFDVISWDDPDSGTPMLGTLSPQECVNRFGAKPSECDIVIVVLWARMGTPLPATCTKPNGERYRSGTEWEFEDAVNADPAPELLVYRRDELPVIKLRDPLRAEKNRQFTLVEEFFAGFEADDGSLLRGHTLYASPAAFAERLESDLKQVLRLQLEADEAKRALALREREDNLAERERALRDREEAVDALLAEARKPAEAPGIEEALKELAAGDATAAKAIFDAVIKRETTEGLAALARAAEAARHKGTLAMLDSTLEALAAFRCAADLDPADAWTWIHISRLEAQGGKLVAAEDAARRARQTAEAKGEERDVQVAMDELGDVLVAEGDLTAALISYRDAFAIAQRLADADPANAQWQRDLAIGYERLGGIEARQGHPKEAIAAYERALAAYHSLLVRNPDDHQSRLFSVVPLWQLGALKGRGGRGELKAALAILKPLAAVNRLDAMRQQWISAIEEQIGGLDH